jgi:hypothetical protein
MISSAQVVIMTDSACMVRLGTFCRRCALVVSNVDAAEVHSVYRPTSL